MKYSRTSTKTLARIPAFVFLFLLYGFGDSSTAQAKVTPKCIVQYETKQGWSKPYVMEVVFILGEELNHAVGLSRYSARHLYAQIWFGRGQVAIIPAMEYTRASLGRPYKLDRFRLQFRPNNTVIGEDQEGKTWKIETMYSERFIYELESEKLAEALDYFESRRTEPASDEAIIEYDREEQIEEAPVLVEASVVFVDEDIGFLILESYNGFILAEYLEGYWPEIKESAFGFLEDYTESRVIFPDVEEEGVLRIEGFWLTEDEVIEQFKVIRSMLGEPR